MKSGNRNARIRFGVNGEWHPVFHTTSILSAYSYMSKGMQRFYIYRTDVYDGGAFHMMSDNNSTYSPASLGFGLGTCTTAESTLAKAVTLSSYTLTTGSYVFVSFTNGVPAGATMNINGKGAKPMYYHDAAIAAGVISAGDTAMFLYNGSKYVLMYIEHVDVMRRLERELDGVAELLNRING